MKRRLSAWPRLLTALHVRVTALFLGLLAAIGLVYYFWIVSTVYVVPKLEPEEELWYSTLAAAQMDSLAVLAAGADPQELQEIARQYGEQIAVYEGEVVFFAAGTGQVLAASNPDSLAAAVAPVDPQLLHEMATTAWSFDTIYPDPTYVDGYLNRIFNVAVVKGPDGQPQSYLAGSYRPVRLTVEEALLSTRELWLHAILVSLVGSFLVGWVIMALLTRRIRNLSQAVGALAAGRLSHRVQDSSRDDLGSLGRDFNAMAERLEELIGQLRNKEHFQRQLVANISHDLRTPLASLRGYVEMLSLNEQRPEPVSYRRSLRIINDNCDHMERLISRLLLLSRLDAGQAHCQSEDFRLPELVESVLDRCRAQADERGIGLACRYCDDLPPVHADPLQIGQVLQNLLENGIKFGREKGEVAVELSLVGEARAEDAGSGRDPAAVAVVVRDDGPGIAAEDLPHIFERFYTGDHSRSCKGQSNGLGLAIAARIVENHGSRLAVTSEPGRGACFRFTLRAAAVRSAVFEV